MTTLNQNIFDHFGDIFNEALSADAGDTNAMQSPYFIGIMGGTSLDGLDAVLCKFYDTGEIEALEHIHQSFPNDLKMALLALCYAHGANDFIKQNNLAFNSELDVFGWASAYYGYFAADLVQKLLQKADMQASEIGAIGCHGQTVRHHPEWMFSLQLLDANVLAEHTGIHVVSDFRRRDIALGGQGAPLVPVFHQQIFANMCDFMLNLGGIANITAFGKKTTGFDVGVANLLLDAWVSLHKNLPFDENGAWAKTGTCLPKLLDILYAHPFYEKSAPKSTGRESFHLPWLNACLQTFADDNHTNLDDIRPEDVQCTLVHLVAKSVADTLMQTDSNKRLVVCGGGAKNAFLLQILAQYLPNWKITMSDTLGFDCTHIEAMAFAFLARRALLGIKSDYTTITGAKNAVVLGQICFA